MGTVTKSLIGKEDIHCWDGSASQTFNRSSQTGYTVTLNDVDWVGVDALKVYGGGTNRTNQTISDAVSAIGTTNIRRLWLAPGNWTISSSLDLSSYTNITIALAPGAKFSISSGATLTIAAPSNIEASPAHQIITGSGVISFSNPGTVYAEWWGIDGTADNTEILAATTSLASGGNLQLLGKAYVLGADLTVPAAVTLSALRGGTIGGAYTVTISGGLVAGPDQQIFASTITAVNGAAKIPAVWGEWFGVSTSATAAANTTAIAKALVFATAADVPVRLGPGSFPINPFTMTTLTRLIGAPIVMGNLNREGTRLDFTAMLTTQKAITIADGVLLENLIISGPGQGVATTYGVYGGLDDTENLGSYTRIINCTIEDFEMGVAISRWVNSIEHCSFDDCDTAINLAHEANNTTIVNNVLTAGNSATWINISIAGGSGIHIENNVSEATFRHVYITGGRNINIKDNYFEQANEGFIYVYGDDSVAANNDDLTVFITGNHFNEYGATASGSNRYGVWVVRGYVHIDGNTIGDYDSGANTGLDYGIRLSSLATDGTFKGLYVGMNAVGAVNLIDGSAINIAARRFIWSPFTYSRDTYVTGGSISTGAVFDVPGIDDSTIYKEFLNIRQIKMYVISALNADITAIDLDRLAASDVANDYMDGLNFGGVVAQGTEVKATNTEFNANGNVLSVSSGTARAFKYDLTAGTYATGAFLITTDFALIRLLDIST